MNDMKNKTEEYWKQRLSPEQYEVLRQGGTEPAFTGEYVDLKEDGMFHCAACGQALFSSGTKYDSGTGWPSFWQAVDPARVELREDTTHGLARTEVVCANCGSHLGHVFDDGPRERTGKRFCINSCALKFEEK